MKIPFAILLLFLGAWVFFGGRYFIFPNDVQAAFVWNFAVVSAPVIALFFQGRIAKERQVPIGIFLTVIAVINTALVLGARAGAWNWRQIFFGEGIPDHPGKTILGGIVLAILVFAVLRRWWRLPYAMADALFIGLPVAGASARVGCLSAGCCFGVPTGGSTGICYGPGSPAFTHQVNAGLISPDAVSSLAIYPVQLFLLIGNLFIFSVLWINRKRFKQPGALFFLGFSLLAAQRFGIEFFREAATNRGELGLYWGGLKIAQWICLLLLTGGLLGFFKVHFGKSKPVAFVPNATLRQQACVLAGIALAGFLFHDLLTLDEILLILISCLPAMIVLVRGLIAAQRSGQKVFAPAMMLSATALSLFLSPLDSIGPNEIIPGASSYRHWTEVGASGAFGSYKDISRDCDGNAIQSNVIKYKAGGLNISSNWQRDELYLKAGIRGAFGKATSKDPLYTYNYDYTASSYGFYGGLSYKWIGASLGVFARDKTYKDSINGSIDRSTELLPSFTLRLGLAARYSLDFRLFDEPAFGFSNEPVFSMGLANWGFDDPSGNTFLRLGLAVTSTGESAFHLAGRFPLGTNGLSGDLAAYLGNANMLHIGLHYRFGETR